LVVPEVFKAEIVIFFAVEGEGIELDIDSELQYRIAKQRWLLTWDSSHFDFDLRPFDERQASKQDSGAHNSRCRT
jgi:hypothetical protein